MKSFAVMIIVQCGIAVSVFLAGSAWAGPSAAPLPKGILPLAARPAPAMVLNDINGNRFDLTQLLERKKGRWVFVHFWASWCGPCRREMPAIQRMLEKLDGLPAGRTFDIAIVNTAEDEDTVFTFLGVLAPDVVPLMDRDGTVTEAWQPRGLPSTYLVDPQGIIRFQALGGRPWDDDEYLRFLRQLSAQP
jgi:thiol-disulfide isomerase/thioredoxin